MSNEKIKPKLNGTAETMLQCFYARAMHSRNPKNKFRDTKAEELIDRIDYDFSNAKKDTAMSGGIVARSVVFEELVSDFIRKNPSSTSPVVWTHGFTAWIMEKLPGTISICRRRLRCAIPSIRNPAVFPRLRVPCSTRHGPIR